MGEKKNQNESLFLVDGSSWIFRSYHALPDFRNSEGLPTGAVYGFVNFLQGLLDEYHPDNIIVAFDRPEPTFRHEDFADYKANRTKPPEDLARQFPVIWQVLEAYRIAAVERPGYEADDLIGVLSVEGVHKGFEVTIVTSDKDLLQLVGEHVRVLRAHFKNSRIYREKEVFERYGCRPENIPDLFGLIGDSIDNIPGVPGIGEKTAAVLIGQYGTLENLYAHLDDLKGKRRQALQENKEQAFLSRQLVRIKTDLDMDFEWQRARRTEPDVGKLTQLFENLEFRSFLKKNQSSSGKRDKHNSGQYEILSRTEDLIALCQRLKDSSHAFALDVESNGLNPFRDRLVGISLTMEAGRGWYLPLAHEGEENLELDHVRQYLGPILSDGTLGKIGHHFKFDAEFLHQAGMPVEGLVFETLLASQLADPGQDSHKLDVLALLHLGMQMEPIGDLIGSGRKQIQMGQVSIDKAGPYAAEDADATFRLAPVLREKIRQEGLERLYDEVELPLASVLRDMEVAGVYVDAEVLKHQSVELGEIQKGVAAKVYELAAVEFNIDSPKQLGEVLFDKMGLKSGRKRSTAASVLEKMARQGEEIASLVLEYRQLGKLKSTYLDALPGMINSATGRIHTNYRQIGAQTGRISSRDPNLQNIPIRTELGRRIRRAFQAEEGKELLSADYSQIELRILAHIAEDEGLIQAFQKGEDIHSFTAREVFDLPEEEPVGREYRRRAKAINFGLNYGMTAYGLSQRLDIPVEEAKEYIERFFSRYPRVLDYMEKTREQAEQEGVLRTLMGRKIPSGVSRAGRGPGREAALRAAINAPIQGTAADILKKAMVDCWNMLKQETWEARMILTVHDEIIFEAPRKEMQALHKRVREVMENVFPLQVPLVVDLSSGKAWSDL
jgi:DNA polymerase I